MESGSICGQLYKKKGGGRSRKKHLINAHGEMYDALEEFRYYQCQIQDIELPVEDEDDTSTTPKRTRFEESRIQHILNRVTEPFPYEQTQFQTFLLKLMAVKGAPYALFDDDIFRDMMAHINPGYNVPSTGSLQLTMHDAVRLKRIELAQYIHQNMIQGAITADGWTSADRRKYFGVTLHFVTPKYQMASMVVGMERVKSSQTAETLLRSLSKNIPLELKAKKKKENQSPTCM